MTFSMTERQGTALANMEAYIGIRNPRTEFTDQETFRSYWDLISKRCDGATRQRATETPASSSEQKNRRQAAVVARFQDPAQLYEYAREYARRYQPSKEKLRQLLVQKSNNPDVSDVVMQQMSERLNDAARANELAAAMQRQGKHAQAIRSKLRQRLFSTEVIDHCLAAMTAATGSVLEADAVARKVAQLQRRGLSQRAMRSKLMGNAGDRSIVEAALSQTLGERGDDPALRAAISKLERKHLGRRVLIQRLVGKGFRYADIIKQIPDKL